MTFRHKLQIKLDNVLTVQMLPFVLVGGTQTNQVVINSMLDSYEGVISADTGHVAVHEGGAIEFSGHKVLTIPSQEGKITAQDVENYIETFESDFKRTHGVSRDGLYFTSNRIWNFIHERRITIFI